MMLGWFLGVELHAIGRHDEALAMLRRSRNELVEALGESSPQVIAAQQNIAAIEQAQNALLDIFLFFWGN